MIERVKGSKLRSWFDVDFSIIERLDPLLEDYEAQCQAGFRPERQTLLDLCPDEEHRQLLSDELDHYDEFYPQTIGDAVGDTKRKKFLRFGSELPETIGEYKVLQALGRGGFGVVLCAMHMETKKRVALKVPHPGWQATESLESLMREANVLATLDHEGIVEFYESKTTPDGDFIISTEWIDGLNLEEITKSESLSPKRITEIIRELLAALAYAHKRGIVHRDIKPSNVMIEKSGRVKLLDFGMAKIFENPTFSQNGQLKGSIAYMSPEQANGEVHETDERTDIYGVGVLLYELLAGRRPFVGREEEVRLAIVNDPCPPLTEIAPDVPKTLALICHKAMAKDPIDRFQSADEFSAALLNWQAGKAVSGLNRTSRGLARSRAIRVVAKLLPRRLNPSLAYHVGLAVVLVLMIGVGARVYLNGSAKSMHGTERIYPQITDIEEQRTPAELAAIFWADFERFEARPVSLVTNPPNAKVTFFPLDNVLAPSRERAVIAGVNPENIALKPGDYLVVAELEDGSFTEVYRHVPHKNDKAKRDFQHFSWELKGDTIQLPPINIVPFENTGMTLCGDFWIDKELVSEKLFSYVTNPNAKNISELSPNPVLGVDHDAALKYCELLGRRLPIAQELVDASQKITFHPQPEVREWTSTGMENGHEDYVFNPLYFTWSLDHAIPTDATVARNHLSFRTARSIKPLQAIPNE